MLYWWAPGVQQAMCRCSLYCVSGVRWHGAGELQVRTSNSEPQASCSLKHINTGAEAVNGIQISTTSRNIKIE
jgi:hypothetical protein